MVVLCSTLENAVSQFRVEFGYLGRYPKISLGFCVNPPKNLTVKKLAKTHPKP